jgi:DNA-binding GntR family transcriptional regulator
MRPTTYKRTNPARRNRMYRTMMARRVWAVVTENPQITLDSLAALTRSSRGRVRTALETLRALGYIDYDKGTAHARKVLIPFVVVGKRP